MKLQQMIVSPAVITESELREAYWKQKGRAQAEYMGVLYSDLESEYEPSDAEIQDFYDTHPGLYHRGPRVALHAVSWPKEPSEADRQEVRELVLEIKNEIESGVRDFAEAAEIFSQDGTASNGGDLGTFDRNRMVAPFTEVAFSLPVNQVSDPVETQFGYHLIEVLERIEEDGEVNQVHARHILLKIEPSNDTLLALYTAVEDYLNANPPASFLAQASADSLNVIQTPLLSEGRDIPGLRNSLEGSLFAHQAKVGARSTILQNDDCYYVVVVDEKALEGPAPLDEVRGQIVMKLKEEHNRKLAAEKLAPAVGLVQMGKSFEEAAAEFELTYAVSDTFTATANIPDVGYGTAFNTVALEVDLSELVPEVATRNGLFALRTLWKEEFDEEDFASQREGLRTMLLNRKQRELEEAWYAEKESAAEIVDNRARLRGGTT
jgi:parvulin-like peptidyl-prolyl isomerase